MSEEYLQEEDIVYRVFNEIQGYPRKVDQFSEILADVYCHNAEEFVKQFSNCMYTVIGHKGTGKEMENLLSFVATVVSRCIGNQQVTNRQAQYSTVCVRQPLKKRAATLQGMPR